MKGITFEPEAGPDAPTVWTQLWVTKEALLNYYDGYFSGGKKRTVGIEGSKVYQDPETGLRGRCYIVGRLDKGTRDEWDDAKDDDKQFEGKFLGSHIMQTHKTKSGGVSTLVWRYPMLRRADATPDARTPVAASAAASIVVEDMGHQKAVSELD